MKRKENITCAKYQANDQQQNRSIVLTLTLNLTLLWKNNIIKPQKQVLHNIERQVAQM